MDTTDPNRLGPVKPERIDALERRIEQLELRVGDLEQTPIVGEAPATVGPLGDQSLRDLDKCPTCGGRMVLWCRPDGRPASFICYACWCGELHTELAALRAQLADDRGCPCKLADKPCHPNCACVNPFSSIGCSWCCRYGSLEQRKAAANRIAAQLAARPVVTATDEQVRLLRDSLIGTTSDMYVTAIRLWLSTLNVASVKQVEAWVVGDCAPIYGGAYINTTTQEMGCAGCAEMANKLCRAFVRRTLNVVQEPNNANPV